MFIPLLASGPNLLFESHVLMDWEMETLPLIEITVPVWNLADLHMSRPLSALTSVVDCTSSASRDIWSDLATHLFAISPPLACRNVSSLYAGQILVHDAPTGTTRAGGAGIGAAFTSERHSSVTFENLSRKWNIGLETAKRTLQVTTQQRVRTAMYPLHRQYRVNHLHLNRRRLNGDWFTDTLFSKVTSLQGNTYAKIFTNKNFTTVHPLNSKARVAQALTKFTDDVVIPDTLLSDGAAEVTGQHMDFMKEVNRLKIRLRRSEAGRSNQNYAAEREIGELKKRWRNCVLKSKVPPRLWDYGLIYKSNFLKRIPRGRHQRTGIKMITGETPDISEWIDFKFYDRLWYYDQKKIKIDGSGRRLARWLGVAHRICSDLCYWLLLESGKIIARTTVQHVVREDYLNDDVELESERFDRSVEDRLSDQNFTLHDQNGFYIQDDKAPTTIREEDYGDMSLPETPDVDDVDDDLMDKYLNAELIFDIGTGHERKGRVVKRAQGTSGEPIGRAHANPLFNTREYVVKFTDGSSDNYFTNVIAECMYAQVNSEGNQYQLLSEITDHRSDHSAIQIADGFTTSCNSNRVPKSMTRGWSLLVSWKDGSSDWVPLKDLKDSYPIQIAEYAMANKIANEPAFNWWVHTVLRKRNPIVAKVKRYWRTTDKFGIRLPKIVAEALAIDDQTGTDFWRKALGKEMNKSESCLDSC